MHWSRSTLWDTSPEPNSGLFRINSSHPSLYETTFWIRSGEVKNRWLSSWAPPREKKLRLVLWRDHKDHGPIAFYHIIALNPFQDWYWKTHLSNCMPLFGPGCNQATVPPETKLKLHFCKDSPKAFEFLRIAICTNPEDLLVCPKNPGSSPFTNPMTWGYLGMGCFDHQSYRNRSGFLGKG